MALPKKSSTGWSAAAHPFSSPAAPAPARRPLLATLLSLVARGTSGWCSSRTPASWRPTTRTWSRLEARTANVEGAGAVDLRVLVREALRMRPDRIVVGEVRGAEVVDLLAAMNTGHDGGCGTVHASSAAAVPARVEALALAAGLPRAALHSQLAAGVDAVVHLHRDRAGRRIVREVGCLDRAADGFARVVPAMRVGPDGDLTAGPAAAALAALTARSEP